ncbi:MAG TPA: helix-turn-helix domain-containing protein [Pseudobdellovibrionaceae bacterium]|nr:helix-turn-helix domain-containing protein [Pseudobdellovibrionaceae bacterium]
MDNDSVAADLSIVQSQIAIEQAEAKLRSLTVKRWLRTDEVALYLGTTRASIKKLVMRQRLEPKKLYGRLYFDRHEIDGLIENSGRSASQAQQRSKRWR